MSAQLRAAVVDDGGGGCVEVIKLECASHGTPQSQKNYHDIIEVVRSFRIEYVHRRRLLRAARSIYERRSS